MTFLGESKYKFYIGLKLVKSSGGSDGESESVTIENGPGDTIGGLTRGTKLGTEESDKHCVLGLA